MHAWGPAEGERVVCLHGVTNWGGHFREFATRALPGYCVLAPDLLGHGDSPSEPPWSLRHHLEAVLATVGEEPATWVGHSLGGRLAYELAATRPELVESLVLLDPALARGLGEGLLAFAEDARTRRSYSTFDELIDRRFEESLLSRAPRSLVAEELEGHVVQTETGGWEYRYVQSMLVTTYSELAAEPPPFAAILARTLLVVGETSYVPFDDVIPGFQAALGDRFELVTVPGGHTVLWDALLETATAVSAFLERT